MVVEDGGQSFWHSGSLEGSTSIAAHDKHGFTWAALINSKLEPNDLSDFLRHTIRSVFMTSHAGQSPDSEMENDVAANSLGPAAVDGADQEIERLVDSVSADRRSLARLVIPDYRLSEVITSVSSK